MTGILLSGNPREGAVINGIKPKRSVPGRAQVVHRELGVVGAQMTWTPLHRSNNALTCQMMPMIDQFSRRYSAHWLVPPWRAVSLLVIATTLTACSPVSPGDGCVRLLTLIFLDAEHSEGIKQDPNNQQERRLRQGEESDRQRRRALNNMVGTPAGGHRSLLIVDQQFTLNPEGTIGGVTRNRKSTPSCRLLISGARLDMYDSGAREQTASTTLVDGRREGSGKNVAYV